MNRITLVSMSMVGMVACTQSDSFQKLYSYELSEREKNLEYCVIKKIHKDDNHLISYDKTGHKNISEAYHVTYFMVKFNAHPGIEIEKEDSITFCKNEHGHWLCDDCESSSASVNTLPAKD